MVEFKKSDFVRFLFLSRIVIKSQTGVALRFATVEVYYRQAKEQVSIILKHSFYSITSLLLKYKVCGYPGNPGYTPLMQMVQMVKVNIRFIKNNYFSGSNWCADLSCHFPIGAFCPVDDCKIGQKRLQV